MISVSLRALVLGCLLLFGLSGTTLAHAELVESDPAEGEAVETPAELTATFSIELDPDPQRSFVIVRDSSGAEVARGGVTAEDAARMTVELPALPPGDYLARWQAYDPSDDHIERGTINFLVSEPVATPSPTATSTPATAAPSTPQPTEGSTASPTSSPAPTPSPAPSPSPEPGDGDQTAGMTDVLLALALAGAVIGGLAVYLLRRR